MSQNRSRISETNWTGKRRTAYIDWQLVCFKPVEFRGKLYSREHGKEFKTEHSTATIERNPQQTGKFRLCIDGMPLLEWFEMKFQELKEKLSVGHTQKEEPRRGLRM